MADARSATVVGGGSWGTALACLLGAKGLPTKLWFRRAAHARQVGAARENELYLPGFRLPPQVEPTADLPGALQNAALVLVVVPSHGLRTVLPDIAAWTQAGVPIVNAAKGIENGSLKLTSELLEEHFPKSRHGQLCYLSGPSFAREVAAGTPTAVCLAGADDAVCTQVQEKLHTDRFRVYRSTDVTGVELGGALKNVMALATGCAQGLGFGHNSQAALITRGLAEMTRLAVRRGANPLTLAGLSGLGDLVLTCTGTLSRNRGVGVQLGEGKALEDILDGMSMVAEGVRTAQSAHQLALREGVDMPITRAVFEVLYEDKAPAAALRDLLARPPRAELDDS